MSAHACPSLSSWRLCQVSASYRRANGKLRAALLQRTLPAWTIWIERRIRRKRALKQMLSNAIRCYCCQLGPTWPPEDKGIGQAWWRAISLSWAQDFQLQATNKGSSTLWWSHDLPVHLLGVYNAKLLYDTYCMAASLHYALKSLKCYQATTPSQAFSPASSKETSAEVALAMASVSLGFSFVGSLSSVFLRGFATIFLVPHSVDHIHDHTMNMQLKQCRYSFLRYIMYIYIYYSIYLLLVFLFSDRIEFIAMARAQCCCSWGRCCTHGSTDCDLLGVNLKATRWHPFLSCSVICSRSQHSGSSMAYQVVSRSWADGIFGRV